jgi:hypothetical protein
MEPVSARLAIFGTIPYLTRPGLMVQPCHIALMSGPHTRHCRQLNITRPCRVEQNIDMPDAWNGGDIIRSHTRYICGTGSAPLPLPNATCVCNLRPKGYGGPGEVTKTHPTGFSTETRPGQPPTWMKPCPPFARNLLSHRDRPISAIQSDTFVAPPTEHNLPRPEVGSSVPLLTLSTVTDTDFSPIANINDDLYIELVAGLESA